ncbi:RNA polymerase factor sigma-54 [Paenibacillus alginolyticus]|uniref:RNA polymerase factor sigma-54 n=1 Tax=Paenibacillus alginolyticus TaxID=59839 RepID=A0ABT4GN54_9BACL|nr:RNA polymerase factor sigma-54 [Paenibacillus alginolyticus]MCY9667338.1 RNA polymerase factor sigma-54 [Paenibacillus alginolyticus]MCY9697506.1 RNA polymerase factor sigma-54 [Paenibacillus alginolyticus]MEC0141972.1 RNA polymerase factor sigma-54 [Paenibacillus alginolyticus]
MRPGYGMFQQQAAKMRLTPQLRKAITILKLSTPELLEAVQQEMNDNPILEFSGNEWDAYTTTYKFQSAIGRRDQIYDPLQHASSNEESLERHLKEQLSFVKKISPSIRKMVAFMIGNLDNNGYLGPSLHEISDVCKVDLAQAELALRILQGFDPIGIGARNLRECLLLQVQSLSECFPLVSLLIRNHLKDVADYRIHKLSTILQVTSQEIQAAIDVIKELNPRPGSAYHIEAVHYIIPEVIIEKTGEQLVVLIHQAASPRLSVNGYYQRMGKESSNYNEAAKFLSVKLNSAMFFLKCLEQRRKTIFRVAQAIVEEQTEFFWKGASFLKPMTLKHIADKLGVHESTVSRATVGKYAQTPWGIFELKHFFPSGLLKETGDSASSEHIKARIKEWIQRENIAKPYSDQKLTELMIQEGIQISRRTVTKYREELGISSSLRRKRI